MAYRSPQSNFSRGEIAPELFGRFDVQTYGAALKRARNVVVLKTGAVTMRPGTRFVGETYDSTQPARLLPFQFSVEQAYALEFGQGIMRPNALGGQVLETELAITGISNATAAVVSAAYHGFAVGDDVYLSGIVGMEALNNRSFRVTTVIDAGRFAININTAAMGAFVSAAGGVTNSAPPAAPPTPPVVPPVVAPPVPPVTGSGGGAGYNSGGGGGAGGHIGRENLF